jgi:glucose-1-phosphate thymidylyltransferase
VANKPILFYAIEAIRAAGIRQIGIIVGETADEVRSMVGNGHQWDVEVTYIQQDAPRGLAHAVQIAESFVGNDSFLMFLGDNLMRDGVRSFVEQFKARRCNALVLLSEVSEPQRFGVAKLCEGRLVGLIEKPKIPPSNLALVGVYIFDHNIFGAIGQIRPSWRNELEITDAIQALIDSGHNVEYCTVAGWWKDTGKPEDVLEANRLMLEGIRHDIQGHIDSASTVAGRVEVEEGAVVTNSVIRGPAIIGRDAQIVNSYIGPFTSICANVHILNSEIENSIVLENTVIADVETRIDDSLIGKNVSISTTHGKPKTIRFVLGDQSQVEIG